MNNQYSRGCGYNYRRSAQRDMNMTRSGSSNSRMQGPEMSCPVRRSVENKALENRHMENRSMDGRCMEERAREGRCMDEGTMEDRCMEERTMEGRCMEKRTEMRSMERPLAMGYVPMQVWSAPLPICKGLRIGTIFADLHKPFCGRGGLCR